MAVTRRPLGLSERDAIELQLQFDLDSLDVAIRRFAVLHHGRSGRVALRRLLDERRRVPTGVYQKSRRRT